MASGIRLSEIEKKYEALMRSSNSPKTFTEYVEGRAADYADEAAGERNAALTALGKRTSSYGSTAERLAGAGLGSSGYSDYLKMTARAESDAAIKEADAWQKSKNSYLKRSYLGYLDSYKSKQESLRTSVISKLASAKVLDYDEMYAYAAKAGLAPEAANGIYTEVYDSVARSIKNNILSKIYSDDMDVATAASYAKSLGLQAKDVKEIAEAALRYRTDYEKFNKAYLDYLEKLAGHTNTNYNDPK